MKIECPKCKQAYEVDESYSGKTVACECGQHLNIPLFSADNHKAKKIKIILIGLIIACICVSITVFIGMEVWDRYTVSADEYALKAKYLEEEIIRRMENEKEKMDFRIKLYEQLCQSESKSESEHIIKVLQKYYGEFKVTGISENGFVSNRLEIKECMDKIDNQKLTSFHEELAQVKLMQARAAYMKAKGSEWFTTEPGAGREFDSMLDRKDQIK